MNAPIEIDASSPEVFEEAVAWFGAQAPWVSGDSWGYMARLAAQKGDQISGTTVLSVVEDVFREMDRAIANGQPYGEFLRELAPKLDQRWYQVDSPRMKLIFNNNIGGALMEGRLEQMTDPAVMEARPFWLFDGIADWRQSEICESRDGMILPADDPRWAINTPLLHHDCRSGLITLDPEEAAERGGVSSDNVLAAAPPPGEGWGTRSSWRDWEPDPNAFAPALYEQFRAWTGGEDYARTRAEWEEALRQQVERSLPAGASLPVDVVLPREERTPEIRTPRVREVREDETPAQAEARERRQIREYLDAWVVGAKSKKSVTLKTAARDELALPGVVYTRRAYNISESVVEELRPAARRIYEETQAELRALYPSGVIRLYRGLQTPPPVKVSGVLESWTTSREMAERFAGRRDMKTGRAIKGREQEGEVLYYEIPTAAVFAYSGGPNWKNGRYGEQQEFVVTSARIEGQTPIEVL